MPSTWSS